MDFFERMKDYLDRGMDASKDALSKAGNVIQDLGDKGVHRIELMQLEHKCKNEFASLGMQLYTLFRLQGRSSIDSEDPAINRIIEHIDSLRAEIEKRQKE